ncbi:MAG: hypothetical protein ACPGVU_22220, partial [Limisphaerales bacterium]
KIWTSFPCQVSLRFPDEKRKTSLVEAVIVPQAGLSEYGAVRIYNREGVSRASMIRFDEDPSGFDFTASEGKPHVHEFEAKKGQHLEFELFAQRLHSALDGVLMLQDEQGKELAFADDSEEIGIDPVLRHRFERAGKYRLLVHDVQWRGQIFGRVKIRELNSIGPRRITGRIDKPGEKDSHRIDLKAGDYLTVIPSGDAVALMDLHLDGRRVKRAGTGDTDHEPLRYRAPKDGEYSLSVSDLLGRNDRSYTLDIRTDVAPFTVQVVAKGKKGDRYAAKPGSKVEVHLRCTRYGVEENIDVKAFGSKGEYKVDNFAFGKNNKTSVNIFVNLPKDLPANELEILELRAHCKIDGREYVAKVGSSELARQNRKHISHYPEWLDGQVLVSVIPKEKKK